MGKAVGARGAGARARARGAGLCWGVSGGLGPVRSNEGYALCRAAGLWGEQPLTRHKSVDDSLHAGRGVGVKREAIRGTRFVFKVSR